MLRLETLGGLTLTDSAGRHVVSQRRRLALLALLAVAGDRGMTRDKLVGFLWPESATEQARHALEQLLYSLRGQLPPGSLPGADPLHLDSGLIGTDLADFAARLAEGDLEGAAALCRGPFLDGFFLGGSPEFDQWVERERERLAGEQTRVLRMLAERADAQGHHTAEIEIWRRLTAADPLGERAATDLVRALAAVGDWVGALRAAREFAARVRDVLPGEPARDLEAMVERMRGARRIEADDDTTDGAGRARYLIEHEIGRGAAATVYLARDRRYDRRVAVKLLRPEIATATDARRFRREIAILARLYHPHILQLYDSGVMPPESGYAGLFYVMPYVRGESLRQRLQRETRLTIGEAIEIALDVAEALEYAHGQGIIHRDVRPENILLEAGHALVADFGIAGVLETAAGERLSSSGIVLGVPAYTSPEQARGEKAVDGRTDIYSLGCTLYEILGGEPPFTGASSAAVLARHMADAVPPLRTIRPDVPTGVERAVVRALAKRPEERFPTAGAFAAALRQG
jgi:DNA-binding SARP family transcriptional activator